MTTRERLVRRTYAVVGSTQRELERALERFGPRRGGRTFAAHTDWEIHYELGAPPTPVVLVATVTLPRWIAAGDVEPGLLDAWSRYLAALERHEDCHLAIARSAAAELARELDAAVGDAASAREVARGVSRRAREAERELDLATGHGSSQGARLRAP